VDPLLGLEGRDCRVRLREERRLRRSHRVEPVASPLQQVPTPSREPTAAGGREDAAGAEAVAKAKAEPTATPTEATTHAVAAPARLHAVMSIGLLA